MTARVSLRYGSFPFLALVLLGASGCSNQASTTFLTASPLLAKVGGKAMGGELPIVGATVTMYSSAVNASIANGSYVGTATVLGTPTTTGAGGIFSFTGVTSCSPSQIVYITIAGGNNGAGTNPNTLNAAVLGYPTDANCDGLPAFTDVNEVTTVAAAYAFSSFLSINGSAVNITAPANNNSLAASNNVIAGAVSTASGLLHAYSNAVNLANATTGAANTAPPTNSNAIAPAAVVNTLANILQACVNSTGGAAPSGVSDGSTCGNLFANTPSQTDAYPTTTLQAAMNLARNPAAHTTALFALAPGTGAAPFLPALSSAPKDWTLAIAYPVPANPVGGVGFPFTLALDADDNVYVTSPENDPWAANSALQSTTNSLSSCLFGWTSNGAFRPTIVPFSGTPDSIPTTGNTAGTQGSSTAGSSNWFCSGAQLNDTQKDYLMAVLAADNVGNIWISNFGITTNSQNVIVDVSNAGQWVAQYVPQIQGAAALYQHLSVAVDKFNNVWFSEMGTGSGKENIGAMAAGGGTTLTIGAATTASTSTPAPRGIAFDSIGNFFATSYGGGTGLPPSLSLGGRILVDVINGSQSNAANYGTGTNAPFELSAVGGSASSGATNNGPYGIAIDSSNNVWVTAAGALGQTPASPALIGLAKCAPTTAGAPFTTASKASNSSCVTVTPATFTTPKFLEADGNNVLWIADSSGIQAYASTLGTPTAPVFLSESGGFLPCIPGSGTSAACTYPDNSASTKGVAVDSTGSVWWTTPDLTTTNTNANMLIQMIGTGTSAWPLLAVQKPGTMPQ